MNSQGGEPLRLILPELTAETPKLLKKNERLLALPNLSCGDRRPRSGYVAHFWRLQPFHQVQKL